MSRLNVDQLGGQTTSNIEVISGNTLKVGVIEEISTNNGVQIDGALIKDGKIAASAGGSMVLLSSNTVSASSGTTVDNVFTSDYTNYKIIAHLTGFHTTTQQFQMVLRASSTDDTNSSYSSGVRTFRISADAEFETRNDATTSWNVSGWDGSQTGNAISREISLFGPQSNRRTLFSGTGMTDEVAEQQFIYFGGSFENTTSFDGIKIYPSAGTWTGQINIYGYAE